MSRSERIQRGEAQRQLSQAVRRQQSVLDKGELERFQGKTGPELVDTYLRSPLFHNYTYPSAVAELFKLGDTRTYHRRFAGKLFADLAYIHTAVKETADGNIVLPESATYKIVKALYPCSSQYGDEFGSPGLVDTKGGIYVPDGLLVRDGRIGGVLEYSLSNKNIKFEPQYKDFTRFASDIPHLVNSPEFVIVSPQGKTNGIAEFHDNIDSRTIPVTTQEVEQLKNHVVDTYRPASGYATLAEINLVKQRQERKKHSPYKGIVYKTK